MRYRAVNRQINCFVLPAQFLTESQRSVIVVFRVTPAREAPGGAGDSTRLEGTCIVLGIGAKPASRQPLCRYCERLTVIRVVLTRNTDARDVPANQLPGIVLTFEYLAAYGVGADNHRLDRSVAVILAKSRVQCDREFLVPVVA